MLIIGLTGGMGSGKTTVAYLFEQLGIKCLDADRIAREIVNINSPAYEAIVKRFGKKIILPSGELNRQRLRECIFEEKEQKKWLENLLHPLIIDGIKKRIKYLTSPYGIIVIPLLFEKGPFSFIDRVLLVDAPEALQLKRIAQRDFMTELQAKKILSHQMARSARLQQADDIILNEGNKSELFEKVQLLHKKYLSILENKK